MKKILVTGAAGFIGYHVTKNLLDKNYTVYGIDNLNNYYDVSLKKNRLNEIYKHKKSENFKFSKMDICDIKELEILFKEQKFDVVINLAAQAGVRYSLENPHAYLKSNLEGFINILECCRHNSIEHLIYASSSSVYGNNTKLPFHEDDPVDHPISLYAATKKSNELLAHTYSHLFQLPCTGLRFFTVYGPWGRPDMAMYLFADAIKNDRPLKLFNRGDMLRDFTFVDDISESIIRLCEHKPTQLIGWNSNQPLASASSSPYRVYNIGNNKPIYVKDLLNKMESFFNKKAIIIHEDIQPGDVPATYADITYLNNDIQFTPKTSIEQGLNLFLNWYQDYNNKV
ncbi:NAD-dependent epimerase/dehydratase family protein [Pigmentibacter sp. JX0631]|uniref:NAD-dependent epimerase/dehydratase family protein n=1 Tax=Pigmentibacter sp. JX0631 TaxID=2976982 RepID=UPI00246862A5|nr:NAD-dependent epimerase/dehydratase family protein [Pigmentibacter sp. JX0631]WGL60852.1 NAD-dependent epimerase/dehydratase family protein [Pigmentibacter sp. JX0631]